MPTARQARVDSPEGARLVLQTQMAKALLELQPHDAIGVALSYLLLAAHRHPEMLRRVLNEPVVREGFRGVSMIETLNRVCR